MRINFNEAEDLDPIEKITKDDELRADVLAIIHKACKAIRGNNNCHLFSPGEQVTIRDYTVESFENWGK